MSTRTRVGAVDTREQLLTGFAIDDQVAHAVQMTLIVNLYRLSRGDAARYRRRNAAPPTA